MSFKQVFCFACRLKSLSFKMAKDKDDSDASPTPSALAGNDSKQKEVPPPMSSAIKAPPPMLSSGKPVQFGALWPDNPTPSKTAMAEPGQAMNPGPQYEVSSPSDPNSPNTASTEEQATTQPQTDDESPDHHELSQWGLFPPSVPSTEDEGGKLGNDHRARSSNDTS